MPKLSVEVVIDRGTIEIKNQRRVELIHEKYSRPCRCLDEEEQWELDLLTAEVFWYVSCNKYRFIGGLNVQDNQSR